MSKLYRSLLWSGLVVAGVAACGDDVTVTPPPPPPAPTVHSVSVAPSPATISVAGTVQLVATVNADAGVATTVTWSGGAGIASVSATGLVTGVAAGTAAITACSTVVTGICGSATIVVTTAPTPTVTQVTVNPPTAALSVGQTITPAAAVIGTNNPSQTVTWSLASGGAAVSVNATTGLITALAAGNAVVKACSTIAGFTTVCGSIALTVTVPSPASVQITNVTYVQTVTIDDGEGNLVPTCIQGTGNPVPVVLTNVRCQIEVTVQINSGDQTLSRVDVLMGGQVMASQAFSSTPSGAELAPISTNIVLSFNTNQVRRTNGFLVPVVFNGNSAITSQLFVVGSSTPFASNAIPVVLNNDDALVALENTGAIPAVTNTPNTPLPAFTDDNGDVWHKGSSTIAGVQYVSFSTKVPTSLQFDGSICGVSTSVVSGNAASGIGLSGVWTCLNSEGENFLDGFETPDFVPPNNGPDGTPLTPPTLFSNIGGGFTVVGDLRWNLITPAVPDQDFATLFIDNKAPTVDVAGSTTFPVSRIIAFNSSFDQWWINDAFLFNPCVTLTGCVTSGQLLAGDGGSGLAAGFPVARVTTSAVLSSVLTDFCLGTQVAGGASLANTVTSLADGYRICTYAEDNVGNVSPTTLNATSAAAVSNGHNKSNRFGKDNVAPLVRLAGSTTAAPTFGSLAITFPAVSATPNTTIFGPFAPFAATDRWGLEALDNAAGFNQNVVAGFPAVQTMSRLNPANNPAANISSGTCGFTNALGTLLSDTWVRTSQIPASATLDCTTAAPGYFVYTGTVVDRAGNSSLSIARNYAIDQYAGPTTTGVGFQSALYQGGLAGVFGISANDDLEIIDGAAFLSYPNVQIGDPIAFTNAQVGYGFGGLAGLGVRWDATLTNVLNGAALTIPYFVRRVEQVCESAGVPVAGCAATGDPFDNTLTNGTTQTVGVTDVNGVTVNVADVASTPGNVLSASMLASQLATPGVAAPFATTSGITCTTAFGPPALPAACTIRNWSFANVGGNLVATHTASTSIVSPYFDQVQLYELIFTGTAYQWTFRGTYVAPSSTDNGFARIWTYSIPHPVNSTGSTGFYRAMGLKGGSGLMTNRAN